MTRDIRLLIVQTSRGFSPEVKVVASLIDGITIHTGGDVGSVQVLLIGGTDERYDPSRWSDSMKAFQGMEHVRVIPLQMAFLGRTGGNKARSLVQLLRQLPGLLLVIRRWRPTIVYSSQQVWDMYLAGLIALVSRVPRVAHVHWVVGRWLGRGIVPLLRASTAVICVSDFINATARAQGISELKLRTIYNSLVSDPFLPNDDRVAARERIRQELGLTGEDQVVGMIGQLREQKGQDTLIQAFAKVRQACPRAYLFLAGEPREGESEYIDRLKQLVATNNLQGRVQFLGFRRDIPQLLAACDVFAHPSRNDAMPLAVVEASAAGLPVVAWNDGGIAEIVDPGHTGLLATPMDVNELAGYLIDLLADPLRASAMGRNGQERVRDVFGMVEASRAFLEVLRGAVDARSREQDDDNTLPTAETKPGVVR